MGLGSSVIGVGLRGAAPQLPPGYDYYLATWGSDSGSGSRGSPWLTASKLVSVVNALAASSSKTAYVATGTYAGTGFNFAPTNTGVTITMTFAAGVTVDTRGTSGSPGIGCQNTGTLIATLNATAFIGDGVNSDNGISAANTASVTINGSPTPGGTHSTFTSYDDGASAHTSSSITAYDCDFSNSTKGAFTFVNSAIFNATRCNFTAKSGATLGLGAMQNTSTGTFTNCTFTPATAGQDCDLSRATLSKCILGTYSLRLGPTSGFNSASLTDCFVHAAWDASATATFTRCYGRISMRVRGATTVADMVMRHCCWVDGAQGATDGMLFGNFDDGSGNWDGIGYDIRDCVIRGFGTTAALGGGFSVNQKAKFDANSQATYTNFFGNVANYVTGMTGTSQTGNITTDPQTGSFTNSTTETDYAVANGSPCVGAGFGGGNIGFTVGDIP